ncbi:class D sortase [Paenibacillus sp. UMB4589-SE434]|uniref:class D sortase n=1 Tax=Paenibacillus sp. UMB4589-SE434 TaxID=3046314 RepID=UPI00254DE2B2|nr:class D sortase [Paenibacillus sp. UMB4589-SE434]MDK8182546.1 class D sortase [Paenibacillus sp. UMB4589-SE434]
MTLRSKLTPWNITIILLLVVGLALILYPQWTRYVEEQNELRLLTEWDSLPKAKTSSSGSTLPVSPTSVSHNKKPAALIDGLPVYGTISIEKIDLREPMVEGATAQSLKLGSGVVIPDRMPGEIGNFVLASHRSRTYGRHFNRLDELEAGDKIKLETADHLFEYTVTSKFVVLPEDLTVLDQREDSKELTLITCEPFGKSTHRLIIKATI